MNGLDNLRCFRKALGERTGQEKLYPGEVIGSFSLIGSDTQQRPAEAVEVIEGDELVRVENLPVPRAVKIDVEGYEHAVIRGLRRTLEQPGCELLCCEVHPSLLPPEVKQEGVLALVKSLGFRRLETYPRWDNTFHLVGFKTGY